MTYGSTYTWNLKKIHEQTKQKQTHRENKLMVARGEGAGALGEERKGVKKHKHAVTKEPQGVKYGIKNTVINT